MTGRISIPALRGYWEGDETMLALVEAVEAAHNCELAKGIDEKFATWELLTDALARFDFGEDPLEGSRPFREVLAEIEEET